MSLILLINCVKVTLNSGDAVFAVLKVKAHPLKISNKEISVLAHLLFCLISGSCFLVQYTHTNF